MTEKKYETASEFIKDKLLKNSDLKSINNDCDNLILIGKQLDKQFINKDELRDKLSKILNNLAFDYIDNDNTWNGITITKINDAKKEILELLEKEE